MPGRKFNFVTDGIYHICSRSIDHLRPFRNDSDLERAILTIEYYRPVKPIPKLSTFLTDLTREEQKRVLTLASSLDQNVDFLAYCLMPNHLHFVIRQKGDHGITRFMSNFHNSYTRFFNLKSKRVGPLFLNQFKAVQVTDEAQLLHAVRYVLLNPYSSGITPTLKDLEEYRWSALPEYLGLVKPRICSTDVIMASFKDKQGFRSFIYDRADYQRSLEVIKHLTLE